MHWKRWRKYGKTDLPTRMEVFWSKVAKSDDPDGCWEWTAGKISDGYGHFWNSEQRRNESAHRVAYEALVGPIPDGLVLDHLCRNRGCVNPAHVEPVTNEENVRRGVSPSVANAKKTHCTSGHPYDAENTGIVSTTGERYCRECRRIRTRERRARARGEQK